MMNLIGNAPADFAQRMLAKMLKPFMSPSSAMKGVVSRRFVAVYVPSCLGVWFVASRRGMRLAISVSSTNEQHSGRLSSQKLHESACKHRVESR